jgi:hypothetical protein
MSIFLSLPRQCEIRPLSRPFEAVLALGLPVDDTLSACKPPTTGIDFT